MAAVDINNLESVLKNLTEFADNNKQNISVDNLHKFVVSLNQIRVIYNNLVNECRTLLHKDLLQLSTSCKSTNDKVNILSNHILEIKDKLFRMETDNKEFQEQIVNKIKNINLNNSNSNLIETEDTSIEVQTNDNENESQDENKVIDHRNTDVKIIDKNNNDLNSVNNSNTKKKKKNINMSTKNI